MSVGAVTAFAGAGQVGGGGSKASASPEPSSPGSVAIAVGCTLAVVPWRDDSDDRADTTGVTAGEAEEDGNEAGTPDDPAHDATSNAAVATRTTADRRPLTASNSLDSSCASKETRSTRRL